MPSEQDARRFIERIAAERKKEINRLSKRLLRFVAEELYAHDVHFILELIQNAQDNTYSSETKDQYIRFELASEIVKVTNNENGFKEEDVTGICDAGESKKTNKTLGYVGEKGIGFKSVFVVSETPRIFSNGFCFQLSEPDYIVPKWFDPPDGIDPSKGTTILLPLRPDYAQGRKRLDPHGVIDEKIILFLAGR